jgi:hypothetical protein
MTITNPSIKAGALVYSVQSGTVQLLGTALVDGSITVQLTSDPAVYVVSTVPSTPRSVTTTVTENTAVVTWLAPTTTGGNQITGYTVTLNTGATCTTTLLTCTFNNLVTATAYSAVVVASNSVGPSLSANVSFTTSGAVVVTPVTPVPPNVPPVTPVPPVIPEEPILPQKPVVIKVPVATNVTAVLANNIPVLNGVRVTAPILFAPNSSSLSKSSIAQLASLAKSFEKQNGQLLVTGFVFYTNVSKAIMKKVATARARAVSLQLAKLGIKVTIGYLGYGANNTKNPKATDRKVELRWVAAK